MDFFLYGIISRIFGRIFRFVNYWLSSRFNLIQNNTGATDYNGLTETINTLLEIICIVAMQFVINQSINQWIRFVRVDWAKYGEFVLAVMSFLQGIHQLIDQIINQSINSGALLLLHANTNIMLLAYIVYILYSCIYQMLITIATFNVAKKVSFITTFRVTHNIEVSLSESVSVNLFWSDEAACSAILSWISCQFH